MTQPTTSIYARVFGPDNMHFSHHHGDNKSYITITENWMNDRLRANGHVFLNEIYDAFGLSRTKAGAICGWLKESGSEIKFTVTPTDDGLLLDFNVDGVIYDKLP